MTFLFVILAAAVTHLLLDAYRDWARRQPPRPRPAVLPPWVQPSPYRDALRCSGRVPREGS